MTKGESLLLHICRHVDDIDARLIYADWIDENEQAEQAEFIRVQCELARGPRDESGRYIFTGLSERHDALRRRERELWREYQDDWFANVTSGRVDSVTAVRGFLEQITCTCTDWLTHGSQIVLRQPVRQVTLTGAMHTVSGTGLHIALVKAFISADLSNRAFALLWMQATCLRADVFLCDPAVKSATAPAGG